MKRVIVLTGAHLTPALALTARLEQQHWRVFYLRPDSAKFNRHQPLISLLSLSKLPYSLVHAWSRLRALKPLLVVSFGGYAALPVCLAAKLLGLRLIIHEQTFGCGLTSKITGFLAEKIALSWPQSQKYFPINKSVLTGNPIRQEILSIKRSRSFSSAFRTIYITGGHQGSRAINKTIRAILPQLLKKFKVYHQFGLAQTEALWQEQRQFKHSRYILKRWFSVKELARILTRAELVISRSGMNTVTELAYLKQPALLIPLPFSQNKEQQQNAQFLQDLGLALILDQSQLNPETLFASIELALKKLPQPARISFNRQLIKNASDSLYQLIVPFAKSD